jgi:hypothetical protein
VKNGCERVFWCLSEAISKVNEGKCSGDIATPGIAST